MNYLLLGCFILLSLISLWYFLQYININVFEPFIIDDILTLTCISHIYNEEYLLPFWLEYHKSIFDHGIIINYHCSDRSIDICKAICPTWEIVNTKNESFEAEKVDQEVMEIERRVKGYKIVLNVTEFIIPYKPLKTLLHEYTTPNNALCIKSYIPYSQSIYEPSQIQEFLLNLTSNDIRFIIGDEIRGHRLLHNYDDGKYHTGRHRTNHECTYVNNISIIWCGFYPMNENLMHRKMQIKNNIPQSDKEAGLGYQHLWDRDRIMQENNQNYALGKPLQELDNELYEYLKNNFNTS